MVDYLQKNRPCIGGQLMTEKQNTFKPLEKNNLKLKKFFFEFKSELTEFFSEAPAVLFTILVTSGIYAVLFYVIINFLIGFNAPYLQIFGAISLLQILKILLQ